MAPRSGPPWVNARPPTEGVTLPFASSLKAKGHEWEMDTWPACDFRHVGQGRSAVVGAGRADRLDLIAQGPTCECWGARTTDAEDALAAIPLAAGTPRSTPGEEPGVDRLLGGSHGPQTGRLMRKTGDE